nr:Chain A, GLUTATHIONE S-TRANSFERASE [Todarodes pacificus]2GSQ_A Chain A, GLUTATHIONE S-TRANSFERASE [Nototodarus sloanii]
PKYTLHYFPLMGRAELCRFVLAAHGEEFTDRVVEMADWPNLKATMYSNAMPVLDIDGTKMSQSMCIARHLAREFGLDGKTSLEKYRVDEITETLQDIFNDVVKIKFAPEAAKEAVQQNYEKSCKRLAPFLEGLLVSNGGGDGFFVGNSMTLADLHCYVALEVPLKHTPELLKDCPKIVALRKRVAECPKIAAYLKKRPVRDF